MGLTIAPQGVGGIDPGQLAARFFLAAEAEIEARHRFHPTPGASRDLVQFAMDKYLRTEEETTMPQIVEPTEPDAQREIIRESLNEIATEVGTALRDAHLDFPVVLTVPTSGQSFATIATPLDPSDSDWSHASAIVCRIIGQRLGGVRLRGRSLHCAVANATMGATEVMADAGSEE